tara:strand:+ start:1003 stop:1197 length:195 start_codon:yes stop_codon:yes gene_type:complete
MGRYMAKCENLEEPREGLIKQEIISYEMDKTGIIRIRKAIRHYYADGEDYIDTTHDETLNFWGS